MKNIIIGCAPRTGSTLLQMSLAQHPQAVSGAEWFNPRLAEIAPAANARKQAGQPCNLIKLFGHQQDCEGFWDLLDGAYVVHLYREDREAQRLSFKRACASGRWMAEHEPGQWLYPEPEDLDSLMDGHRVFEDLAQFSVSYEFLISHWHLCVFQILSGAQWPVRQLGMATRKMGNSC